jgi:hypothetical protein
MTTGKRYKTEKAAPEIANFLRYYSFYSKGAARRAKDALRDLFPGANFRVGGEEADATMEHDGETYPVFISVYPFFEPQQLAEDIQEHRKAAGKGRALIFFITPSEEADKLAAKLRDDYPTLNAGVYVWKLDLDETQEGWEWKRGEKTCIASL